MDGNRLHAIKTIVDLAKPIDPADDDRCAALLRDSFHALGVTDDEVQTAMMFAVLTNIVTRGETT